VIAKSRWISATFPELLLPSAADAISMIRPHLCWAASSGDSARTATAVKAYEGSVRAVRYDPEYTRRCSHSSQ